MCHVLIIEDEPLVAMMLEDALTDAGALSIDIVATEAGAVAAAAARRPDFITSDVALVEGTGPAAVQAILRAHGDVPVLFITATPEACSPCAPPGRIMAKPVRSAAVSREFRSMLGGDRQPG